MITKNLNPFHSTPLPLFLLYLSIRIYSYYFKLLSLKTSGNSILDSKFERLHFQLLLPMAFLCLPQPISKIKSFRCLCFPILVIILEISSSDNSQFTEGIIICKTTLGLAILHNIYIEVFPN